MAGHMLKRVAALAVVVLLTLELVPQPSSAKFRVTYRRPRSVSRLRSQERFSESILIDEDSSTNEPPVAVEMIPHHHEKSPFHQPELTRPDRIAASAERSRARGMRLSAQSSDSPAELPYTSPNVYYNGASYIMNFTIGSPPRTFSTIADTGSSLCWVQCQGCNPCAQQPNNYFIPFASSTYAMFPCTNDTCRNASRSPCNLQQNRNCYCDLQHIGACHYTYPYDDQSETDGTLATDTITLVDRKGNNRAFDTFYFGCGLNQTGNFSGADGITGLGQGPLSLVSQLGGAINYTFSYCLVAETMSNLSSALLLGSTGRLTLNYTKLVASPESSRNLYYVDLRAISVGGVNISYPSDTFDIDAQGKGGIALDSGTTFTLLARLAYTTLVTQLKKQIPYDSVNGSKYKLELCYNTSSLSNVKFPTVTFTLGTLVLSPNPAENIFIPVDEQRRIYCLAVLPSPSGSQVSLLGNVWQQNFQIAYDLKNQMVGFAKTTCGRR